jgi:hypothetical protein
MPFKGGKARAAQRKGAATATEQSGLDSDDCVSPVGPPSKSARTVSPPGRGRDLQVRVQDLSQLMNRLNSALADNHLYFAWFMFMSRMKRRAPPTWAMVQTR